MTVLAVLFIVGCCTLGLLISVVGAITALTVAYVRLRGKMLGSLGAISYSLYLVHSPIGGRVINLGCRWSTTTAAQLATLAAALIITVVTAYLFYVCIERPAQRWSSTIRYGSSKRRQQGGASKLQKTACEPDSDIPRATAVLGRPTILS
jgi:peptidoglycan/LPS O-acetylase OafA/YrhL